jgi:hypothetical protein
VIEFVHFKQDMDATLMLKGLPSDHRHCPQRGYVLKER